MDETSIEAVSLPNEPGSLIIIDPANSFDRLQVFMRNGFIIDEDYPEALVHCFETGNVNGFDLYTEDQVAELAEQYGYLVIDMTAMKEFNL